LGTDGPVRGGLSGQREHGAASRPAHRGPARGLARISRHRTLAASAAAARLHLVGLVVPEARSRPDGSKGTGLKPFPSPSARVRARSESESLYTPSTREGTPSGDVGPISDSCPWSPVP